MRTIPSELPAPRDRHSRPLHPLVQAMAFTSLLVATLILAIFGMLTLTDSPDSSAVSLGKSETVSTPYPPVTSTIPTHGLPVVILATTTPHPTTAPRPTTIPPATCPAYGTATEPGICFTFHPTATAAPVRTPNPEPTFAACLPTPIPGQYCRYGTASPGAPDGR